MRKSRYSDEMTIGHRRSQATPMMTIWIFPVRKLELTFKEDVRFITGIFWLQRRLTIRIDHLKSLFLFSFLVVAFRICPVLMSFFNSSLDAALAATRANSVQQGTFLSGTGGLETCHLSPLLMPLETRR